MKVGSIGLATMGSNAALNVAPTGFEMVVYDVRPKVLEDDTLIDLRVASERRAPWDSEAPAA